jgi:hypothetical protein
MRDISGSVTISYWKKYVMKLVKLYSVKMKEGNDSEIQMNGQPYIIFPCWGKTIFWNVMRESQPYIKIQIYLRFI